MKATKGKFAHLTATRNIVVATGLAAMLAVGLGGMLYAQNGGDKGSALLRPDDRNVVALGQQVYSDQCASCHGDNLEGQPDWRETNENGLLPAPPHDETGHTWHHEDAVLFGITKYGLAALANMPDYKTDMPVYKDILSDEEIIAVLSYIKSKWPDEIRKMHDQRNTMK
ncbi:cytochrome c [uncultured Cohaesibacter sp.]|uniref:c-type cytochrome n=1 Tax=uncultured Cohaesibacter sp. TaxID=1002546 RepID=UPI0029C7CE57|nr:cytochrome c [uncultured Cohaesibacter sp.]